MSCGLNGAGLPETLNRFVPAAQACLQAPPAGVAVRQDLEADALAALNAQRDAAGVKDLRLREALSEAARLHAIDMATRGYAAHVDPEGRGHLDRIRALDRSGLIGAAGGNLAILSAGDASSIAASLSRAGVDQDNVLRGEFTDAGVGVAEAGGRIFAVAVFAHLDGELETPIPVDATRIASLRSDIDWEVYPVAGLRLASAQGEVLAQSLGSSITLPQSGQDSYLEVAVERPDGVLLLRGPAVSGG